MDMNKDDQCCSPNDLDMISVLRLELMDQLITCKKEMENSLQEGYFLLGKTRYIMGTQSVSMLQVPSEAYNFESHYQISVSKEPLNDMPSFSSHEFSVVPKEKTSLSNLQKENLTLRKRGIHCEDMKSDIEIEDDNAKGKKMDPLYWFSALPPQSLRKAQQHFRQAMFQTALCATIQSKLNALNHVN